MPPDNFTASNLHREKRDKGTARGDENGKDALPITMRTTAFISNRNKLNLEVFRDIYRTPEPVRAVPEPRGDAMPGTQPARDRDREHDRNLRKVTSFIPTFQSLSGSLSRAGLDVMGKGAVESYKR